MSKVVIILCLAGLIAGGSAKVGDPDDPETLRLGNAIGLLQENLPSWKDVEDGLRTVIVRTRNQILRNKKLRTIAALEALNIIEATGVKLQNQEQAVIMDDMQPIIKKYAPVAGKFKACDSLYNNLVSLANSAGNGFYECHLFYNQTAERYIVQIPASIQEEFAVLDELKSFDCNTSEAVGAGFNTVEGIKANLKVATCLVDKAVKFYTRPQTAAHALFYFTETIERLKTSQDLYWYQCPAYERLALYAYLKPIYVKQIEKCVSKKLQKASKSAANTKPYKIVATNEKVTDSIA